MTGEILRETERDTVVETVTRLFVTTDRRDWPAVRACFADAVLFDMSSLSGEKEDTVGADEIVAGWRDGLRALQAIHHQVGNFLVTFAGGGAEVFCYGIAFHYLPSPTGGNVRRFVGSYDFHLVRSGTGWRIDAMAYRNKFTDGNLNLGMPGN